MTPAGPAVLVVDDDPDTCRNMADILSDLGYRVETAQGGPAALELARGRPFDLALLDFSMPGMNGLELYRRLKQLRPEVIAIIISAHVEPAMSEASLGSGVWRVLDKPVDPGTLLRLFDQALDQPLVLVVDDDPDLCANLWDLLHQRGYRVCLAHDGAAAAERLRGRQFDIALIDLRLPDGDGSDVARAARATNPGVRTVVITGHQAHLNELVEQAMLEGADAVCFKPLDVPDLLHTLARLAQPPARPGAGPEG